MRIWSALLSISILFAFAGSAARAADIPTFYVFDDSDIVGDRGDIVRSEPVTDAIPNGIGYRVLYRTNDVFGKPTLASTLVFLPATATSPEAKIVVWAHKTTGIRAKCAPSIQKDPMGAGNFVEVPGLSRFLADGNVVVAPDYVGLGAVKKGEELTAIHPYLHATAVASSIIDAVKAARLLPATLSTSGPQDLKVGTDVAIFGHSQGGHAALAAASMLKADASGLKLLALAVSAPPTRLDKIVPLQRSVIGIILTAYLTKAYETIDPALKASSFLAPELMLVRDKIADLCVIDGIERSAQDDEILKQKLAVNSTADTDGRHLVKAVLPDDWIKALGASQISILNSADVTGDYPILLSQGASDPLVPFRATRDDVARPACRFSQLNEVVLYLPFGGHDSQFGAAEPDVVSFVRNALAGKTPVWPSQLAMPEKWTKQTAAEFRLLLECKIFH